MKIVIIPFYVEIEYVDDNDLHEKQESIALSTIDEGHAVYVGPYIYDKTLDEIECELEGK